MDIVTLIDSDGVKTLVPQINSNLNDDKIRRHIIQTQNILVKPLLGEHMFNEIISQITNDNMTDANKVIMDNFIIYIMAYAVYRRIIIYDSVSVEESGSRTKNSLYSEPIDSKIQANIAKAIDDDVDFYIREFKKYMCDNSASYPLYNTGCTRVRQQLPNFDIGRI